MKQLLPIVRILLLIALFGQSPAGSAQEGLQEAQDRLRAANVAYEAGHYENYVANLEAALAMNPASLRTLYNLACGYALLGENERSLDLLDQLVAYGVDYGIAEDPDLASLRTEPAYEGLLGRLERNVAPIAASRHLLTIDEFGLIPEGIAYEPASGRIFFGSMRNGGIYVVDPAGRLSRFAGLDIPGFSAIGLTVDPGRGILWAIGTATKFAMQPEAGAETGETGTSTELPPETRTSTEPETRTSTEDGTQSGTPTKVSPSEISAPTASETAARTGVFGFELATGEPAARMLAESSIEGFNDVTVAPNGDLYLSGSALGVASSGSNTIRPLTTSPLLVGTNGIAVSPDGATLFTSVYPVGVARIDLASGKARFLELPDDVTLYGIDGLYFHEGDLVAIQNGTEPWRLIRISLNEQKTAVTTVRVLERGNPHVTATTGSITGNEIRYVGQGPPPDPPPTHVPAPLVPFFGQTIIMAAPLD